MSWRPTTGKLAKSPRRASTTGRREVRPILAGLLLIAMLLPGCQSLGSGASTTTSTALFTPEPQPKLVNGCLKYVCLANQSSPDAQLAMSNYGLRQINADDGTEYAVLIESDFVVWQQGRSYMGERATSI